MAELIWSLDFARQESEEVRVFIRVFSIVWDLGCLRK